jgi:GntR family transcriptional regulator
MHIDKNSPIPAYYQLKTMLLERIQSGFYKPGHPIPSERELSDKLHITRMTVRQAVNQLVQEGVLYREKGNGTFVSRSKFQQKNIMSFSDMVQYMGQTPSTRILHFEETLMNEKMMSLFGQKTSIPVYVVKRLRLADGEPIGIEEVYLPKEHCPGLDAHDLTGSLRRLLRDAYHQVITQADNIAEARRATSAEKNLLMMPTHMPVLQIACRYFTKAGNILYCEESAYRSDRYQYHVTLSISL